MAEPAATSGDSSTAGTVTGIEPTDDEQGIEAIEELLKTLRFWVAPIIAVVALIGLLATSCLDAFLNPTKNLHHFPICDR